MTSADITALTITPCQTIADAEAMTELDARIWGDNERNLTPSHIFLIAAKIGGQALIARHAGAAVGISLAFMAQRAGAIYLHSHLTGVIPEWQNRGVGLQLKLAQRADALARGITRMEWTFDPLAVRNAWFNLVKLGATMRRFIPDLYGVTESALHGGLPTDRLVAEWQMDSPRVAKALGLPTLAPPEPAIEQSAQARRRITLPTFHATQALAEKRATQAALGARFTQLFQEGWEVTGLEQSAGETAYLLTRAGQEANFA